MNGRLRAGRVCLVIPSLGAHGQRGALCFGFALEIVLANNAIAGNAGALVNHKLPFGAGALGCGKD